MQKIIVLLGPNASGKSDLGIRLARTFGGEIVSADSRQVYRGLDIGAGKVSADHAGGVRHHLIDVAELRDRFSAADYQRMAYQAIDEILDRGCLPFVVGGTGLYIGAVVDGYLLVNAPPNPELRSRLEHHSQTELAEMLLQRDPEAGRWIDLRNGRRLIRAIEIVSAGYSYSETRRKSPKYSVLQLGLTWDWPILEERINRRLANRLAHGMIEEAVKLKEMGVPNARLLELGLEYRYLARYLNGEIASREELYEQLRIAIRQFARRQLTWFKRDRRIFWLDSKGNYFEQACGLIRDWLLS